MGDAAHQLKLGLPRRTTRLSSFLYKFLYADGISHRATYQALPRRSGQTLQRGVDSSIRYTADLLPLTIDSSAEKLILSLTKYLAKLFQNIESNGSPSVPQSWRVQRKVNR
jgi:hypothetical protein